MYYGFSGAQWNKAKEEVRRILINKAKDKDDECINYGELAAKITAISLEPHSYALANMIGEISVEEFNAGHGMLSALVVNNESKMPGSGFFKLADELGLDSTDKEAFWIQEFNKVIRFWTNE